MPIDRDAALKTAERLLRQGKLDGAIEQYVRLVEEQPRDWNSINALGDLYVRAGDPNRAVTQYLRIADYLFEEGFLPKAAALYKKALKVRSDHEHTLSRLSDIAARQGLLADAKLYLRQLAQVRKTRGDEKGVAECIMRMGALDENDPDAKMTAARAAQAGGDVSQAVSFFHDAATAYEKQKRPADALDARVAAAELCPEDAALRAAVAKALIDAGQIERAQPFLSADAAGDDVDLMLAMGRRDLLSGRRAEAHATLMRVVALAPDRQDVIAALSTELLDAGRVADAYDCLEILVDAALFEAAFDRAAAILETFVERYPEIAALLKLVDVYVDAGFDDRIAAVQGRLADAYLEVGRAAEARVIAEDLLTRERHVDAHAERLRRALIALGVDDPDAEIARQLEAAPLFDEPLDLSESERAVDQAEPPAAPGGRTERMGESQPVADSEGSSGAGPVREEWTGRPEPPAEPPPPVRENLEVDLSLVLADLHATTNPVPPATPGAAAAPRRATREDQVSEAATLFERAQEQLRRGMAAEAAAALQAAARVPQFRFRAAAQLGRLSASRGDARGAVEWLERAAEAPAPTPDEGFSVLYELADALDRLGEPARALAVFLELEADAGLFRDVRTRIEQLTRGAAGTTRSATGDRP